jgi:hypothetical protein
LNKHVENSKVHLWSLNQLKATVVLEFVHETMSYTKRKIFDFHMYIFIHDPDNKEHNFCSVLFILLAESRTRRIHSEVTIRHVTLPLSITFTEEVTDIQLDCLFSFPLFVLVVV